MSGRNGGSTWSVAPWSQGNSALQMRPWPKCNGSRQSVRRWGSVPRRSARLAQRAESERWVWTTPLGADVLPEVKSTSASSSGPASKERASEPAPTAVSSEPGAPLSAGASTTSTPSAARRVATPGSGAPSHTESRGRAARASVSTSKAVSRWSMGTTEAPRLHTASRSTRNSGVFP